LLLLAPRGGRGGVESGKAGISEPFVEG